MPTLLTTEALVPDSHAPPHLEDADPRDLGYWYRPAPETPISMRLSRDLGWSVFYRQFGRWSAARVMRRDLDRYYAGVRRTLDRLALTRREAEIAVEALRKPPTDVPGGRVLAAVVEDWADRRARDKAARSAAATLVGKLRKLGPMECYGVIDGIEVFWAQQFGLHSEDKDALLEWAFEVSGLTNEYDRKKSQPIVNKLFGFDQDETDRGDGKDE